VHAGPGSGRTAPGGSNGRPLIWQRPRGELLAPGEPGCMSHRHPAAKARGLVPGPQGPQLQRQRPWKQRVRRGVLASLQRGPCQLAGTGASWQLGMGCSALQGLGRWVRGTVLWACGGDCGEHGEEPCHGPHAARPATPQGPSIRCLTPCVPLTGAAHAGAGGAAALAGGVSQALEIEACSPRECGCAW